MLKRMNVMVLGLIGALCVCACNRVEDKQETLQTELPPHVFDRKEQPVYEEDACVEESEMQSLSEAIYYEGYLDECPYSEWRKEFIYCDFDGDDKQDRVYREVGDTYIAYRIDFGNGESLELARSGDFFMGIKVQATDICASYGNEILFVGKHEGSTDPTAESDIYLYTKNFYGYSRILLPGQETEEDAVTGVETILYDRGDGCVELECPAAGYEEVFDWELWSKSGISASDFFNMLSEPFVAKSTAYDAAFVDCGGEPRLVFYQNVTGKWVIKDISVVLKISEYINSEGRYDYGIERLEHGRFEGITVDELIAECYDGEIPIGMEYVPVYMETVKKYIEEYDESKLTYNLIYFDGDGIPELTIGRLGSWVSMYTYQDGEVYKLMDMWGYGVAGNHGYEYLPYENVIRNFDSDLAGRIWYESYYGMDENFELNYGFCLVQSYEDEEGNVLIYESDEDYDESNWHYYYEDYYEERKITEEECDTYRIVGDYEPVEGEMSVTELIETLYAPLFF